MHCETNSLEIILECMNLTRGSMVLTHPNHKNQQSCTRLGMGPIGLVMQNGENELKDRLPPGKMEIQKQDERAESVMYPLEI